MPTREPGAGTGFAFGPAEPGALADAVARALRGVGRPTAIRGDRRAGDGARRQLGHAGRAYDGARYRAGERSRLARDGPLRVASADEQQRVDRGLAGAGTDLQGVRPARRGPRA